MAFEKDTIYYRADTIFSCGVETSGYLGDNNIDPQALAREIENFVSDADAKTFEIFRYVAKRGDNYAEKTDKILSLQKNNDKITSTK